MRTIWSAWFDSPHKVLFCVLVVIVAGSGHALVSRMYDPGLAPDALNALTNAFGEVLERATYLAGVIAGFARGAELIRAVGEAAGAALRKSPPTA